MKSRRLLLFLPHSAKDDGEPRRQCQTVEPLADALDGLSKRYALLEIRGETAGAAPTGPSRPRHGLLHQGPAIGRRADAIGQDRRTAERRDASTSRSSTSASPSPRTSMAIDRIWSLGTTRRTIASSSRRYSLATAKLLLRAIASSTSISSLSISGVESFEFKLMEAAMPHVIISRLRLSALTALLGCTLLSVTASAAPEQQQSPTLVKSLTSLMEARHLDAIAATDPEAPDRFVAALLMPNVQLLIVSAQYPVPAELQAQLSQQGYRDVYSALHQPSAQATRFFLMDAGCDGLRTDTDAVDVLYEKGTTQTLFDGRWKQQGLSEADYTKRARDAEARYARLLSLLIASLQTTVTGSPGT
jgi:hypothetical protein